MDSIVKDAEPSVPEVGAYFNDVFEPTELDELEHMASMADGAANNAGTKIRQCKVGYVAPGEPKWLFDKLTFVCRKANQTYFKFMLYGFGEQLQLLRYESVNEDHYGWHQDLGGGVGCRKLSFSLQLSLPDAYDGGDLVIAKSAGSVLQMPRTRGVLIFFPSYQMHCVTPVKRGVRHALAGWVRGPAFR